MVHGPCGPDFSLAGCMHDGRGTKGKCPKNFPKEFREETTVDNSGYLQYKQHQNSLSDSVDGSQSSINFFTKRIWLPNGTYTNYIYTNEWIVPYNSYLSKHFNCHMNVKVCSSIKAVKYIYKYIYKGGN